MFEVEQKKKQYNGLFAKYCQKPMISVVVSLQNSRSQSSLSQKRKAPPPPGTDEDLTRGRDRTMEGGESVAAKSRQT